MVTNNWPIQQSAKTMRSEIMTPVEGGTEEAILSIKREPSGWPRVSSTTTTQRLFSEERKNIIYLTVLPQEIDWTDRRKFLDIPIVYLTWLLVETFLLKVLLPCERRVTEGSPAVQRTSSTVRSETIWMAKCIRTFSTAITANTFPGNQRALTTLWTGVKNQ